MDIVTSLATWGRPPHARLAHDRVRWRMFLWRDSSIGRETYPDDDHDDDNQDHDDGDDC